MYNHYISITYKAYFANHQIKDVLRQLSSFDLLVVLHITTPFKSKIFKPLQLSTLWLG